MTNPIDKPITVTLLQDEELLSPPLGSHHMRKSDSADHSIYSLAKQMEKQSQVTTVFLDCAQLSGKTPKELEEVAQEAFKQGNFQLEGMAREKIRRMEMAVERALNTGKRQ